VCKLILASLFTGVLLSQAPAQGLFEPGAISLERLTTAATAAGFTIRESKADIPVAVHSRLSFTTPRYDDKLLSVLREKYRLKEIIASARDEWTAQLLLKEWVHKSIPGGNPRSAQITHWTS
jgi:hypothetical protein